MLMMLRKKDPPPPPPITLSRRFSLWRNIKLPVLKRALFKKIGTFLHCTCTYSRNLQNPRFHLLRPRVVSSSSPFLQALIIYYSERRKADSRKRKEEVKAHPNEHLDLFAFPREVLLHREGEESAVFICSGMQKHRMRRNVYQHKNFGAQQRQPIISE